MNILEEIKRLESLKNEAEKRLPMFQTPSERATQQRYILNYDKQIAALKREVGMV